MNTASDSIIDINDTRTIARGFTAIQIDPRFTDPKVQEWNFTLEKEIANNMVTRIAYVGNHATNILQTVISMSAILRTMYGTSPAGRRFPLASFPVWPGGLMTSKSTAR